MVRYIYQVLSEVALILLYPLFSLAVNFLPQNNPKTKSDKKTIILVERWMTINAWHIYWKYYLRRKGYNVHLINFPIRRGDFNQSAKDLKNYIENNNLKKVVLVGISSGALTSLMYLQEFDGWEKVDKFVSVGAPFRGAWSAIFLFFLQSGRELLPKSQFLEYMNAYDLKNKDKILCIKAKFDEMVPFGAHLNGAKHEDIDVIGHNNLHLRVRTTYKRIADFASK